MDDLGREDVWIVDPKLGGLVDGGNDTLGGQKSERIESSDDGSTVCQVGVESTVAKIEMIPATNNNNSNSQNNSNNNNSNSIIGQITILRHGAISSQSIRDALQTSNLSQYFTVSDSVKFTSEKVHNVAPGQTIKHYSPNVPCFMMGVSRQRQRQLEQQQLTKEEQTTLSQSVIIDYSQRLSHYQPLALAYRDLSPDGNPVVAASHLFETLRWSENVEGAIRVFVPELVLEEEKEEDGGGDGQQQQQALVLAVKDKLTRAASAVVVDKFQ